MRTPAMPDAAEVLRFTGLEKAFGATRALRSVDLDVRAGEIHGLLGQNGSGKSTLIKVLAGLHTPEAGEMHINGNLVQLPVPPRERSALRLAFVHQDLGLLPELSVIDNFWFTRWSRGAALDRIDWRWARTEVERAFADYGLDLDPRGLVRDLSPVQRATLAIVRAIESMNDGAHPDAPGLLVLDEPTVFLAGHDATHLYSVMRQVADQRAGVLFVSHDIDEVKLVTDRVTVFRDGENVGTRSTDDVSVDDIVGMVIGTEKRTFVTELSAAVDTGYSVDVGTADRLTVKGLTTPLLTGVDIEIPRGRVVGIAGLPGSGFEHVLYALSGAVPPQSGTVTIGDDSEHLPSFTAAHARDRGFAFVPSDRLAESCVPDFTVAENNSLPQLAACRRGPILSRRKTRQLAAHQISTYLVRVAGPDAKYSTMSGGNQQKAVLAKWLDTSPTVLLLSQPTQGVDIGARAEIWHMLRESAGERFTLCASLDHDELAALCDEVLIFRQGQIVTSLSGRSLTKDAITDHCSRGDSQ